MFLNTVLIALIEPLCTGSIGYFIGRSKYLDKVKRDKLQEQFDKFYQPFFDIIFNFQDETSLFSQCKGDLQAFFIESLVINQKYATPKIRKLITVLFNEYKKRELITNLDNEFHELCILMKKEYNRIAKFLFYPLIDDL